MLGPALNDKESMPAGPADNEDRGAIGGMAGKLQERRQFDGRLSAILEIKPERKEARERIKNLGLEFWPFELASCYNARKKTRYIYVTI